MTTSNYAKDETAKQSFTTIQEFIKRHPPPGLTKFEIQKKEIGTQTDHEDIEKKIDLSAIMMTEDLSQGHAIETIQEREPTI